MAKTPLLFSVLPRVGPPMARLAPGLAGRMLRHFFLHPQRREMSNSQRKWAATAERGSVKLGEDRIATYLWGEAGPTILLVHGWSGRGSQLGIYAQPLLERGLRVLAFDGPAHGDSDGYHATLFDFAATIRALEAEYGPFAGVIAHSFGCATVTYAASQGVALPRAVFIAPPEEMEAQLRRISDWLGVDAVLPRSRRGLEEEFDVKFADFRGRCWAQSLHTELLAFHDETDVEVPIAEGEALVEAWPKARMVKSKGLGHHYIIRDPAVIEQAVAFLSEPFARDKAS